MDNEKLVTIREINNVEPIPEANAIEVVTVAGWKCVVKKDEFKIGDKIVYFEIDSFLPEKPCFEFLRKNSYRTNFDGSKGFRIKTIKLRGQMSQGLIASLDEIKRDFPGIDFTSDLTEQMGVTKFHKPLPSNTSIGIQNHFPSFIRKTDQEQIQNNLDYFEKYASTEFEITEKLHGTSATYFWNHGEFGIYFWNDGEFGICSRNYQLDINEKNLYTNLAFALGLNNVFFTVFGTRNLALQGEIVGEGINKNPYKIRGVKFFIFDIWDIDKQEYLLPPERQSLYIKLHDIQPLIGHVPFISECKVFERYNSLNLLLLYADRISLLGLQDNILAEGIVCKSINTNNRVSFKVVNNQFLLKEK